MPRTFLIFIERAALVVSFLAGMVAAQGGGNGSQQPVSAPGTGVVQQNAPQSLQAVSQTGVFPVFAVEMNFNPSLVDGTDVPSKAANRGVNDTVQHAWEALQPGGFNTIFFRVDLKDPSAVSRVANLCIWAKANNVALVPILANLASADATSTFAGALVARLRAGDGQQFAAYPQISYFALEPAINVPMPDSNLNLAGAQKLLLGAADALRNAELQALQGTGVQPTPVLVNVSFDYELIQQGAIVGVSLDSATEQKALASLKQSLASVAAAANIDAVDVAWLPRSITSGDEGHFAGLLREVEAALPGKTILLDTGFSKAFNPGDQQSQFITVALTNLAGFRATDGASSRFLGVIISQALNNSTPGIQTGTGTIDPSQWNWKDKGQQLARMWSQGEKSADLTLWLTQIRAGEALLTAPADAASGKDVAASPGLQAIQQFSATVAQVSQGMPPVSSDPSAPTLNPSATLPLAAPVAAASASQAGASSPSVFQQTMQTLVQQVTTQLTTALLTKLTNKLTNSPSPQAPYPTYPAQTGSAAPAQTSSTTPPYVANPQPPTPGVTPGAPVAQLNAGVIWITPPDVTVDAANVGIGQPVHITAQLHNGSPDQDASGLTVQVVDSANPSAIQGSQSGVTVPHSSILPVQLTWVAAQTGMAPPTMVVQVLDASGAQIASAPVPAMTINNVANANASVAGNVPPGATDSTSQTATGQPGQNLSSGNGPVNQGGTTSVPPTGSNLAPQNAPGFAGQGAPSAGQPGISPAPVSPQIVFFGPAAAGPTPSLSLQVSNPAGTVMRSAQAQLFVDGKPGPVQTLGPLLPNQTRSATFNSPAATTGTPNIKVVVTSADGGSATAPASPAPLPASPQSAQANKLQAGIVQSGVSVRSGLPASYNIGTATTIPAAATGLPPRGSNGAASVAAASARVPTAKALDARGQPTAVPGGTKPAVITPSSSTVSPRATIVSGANVNPPANNTATVLPQTGASKTATASVVSSQSSAGANPAGAATVVPQAGSNQGSPNTPVAPPAGSGPATGVRTVTPRPGLGGNPAGVTTVTPATRASQNGTGTTTAVPPGSSGNTNGVVTVVPQHDTRATNPPSMVTTILPPGRGQPGVPQAGNIGASKPSSGIQENLDLAVSSTDIRFLPVAPGQPTTFTAVVHNLGTAGTQNAVVVFTLNADGRTTSSRPVVFSIAAGGIFQASWSAPIPAAQSIQLAVQVIAKGDVNPANNQAVIRVH